MSKHHKKESHSQATGQHAALQGKRAMSAEARHAMIAETAYLLAERRGFQGDAALDDWLRAEAEVDGRLSAGA